ncbi:MAG TPA: PDZ domain-containing protein [Terriglobales bacterium]|nr:PDZ domain-containing protein [Terriglobales bacterium]
MMRLTTIVTTALVAAGLAMPAGMGAEPGNEPYVFYGDDPGGGSYLGVDTQDVTHDRMAELHLKEETGVEITMVDQDAPAGKAGLKDHDVILSINDQKIESEEQLRRVIHEIPAGRTITIGISRDGQAMTLTARLAERSTDHNFNFHFTTPTVNVPAIHIPPINMPEIDIPSVVVIHSPRSSGMMVENLTPQLGDFFGVKSGNGVLIRSVEKGSRAEQAGFRAGDVIVKVNGSSVNDCSDFSRLLRDRKDNKASVVVIRDRKEQTLTLSLPEPRRSGSLQNCNYAEAVTCATIVNEGTEVAALLPEITTAELKRLKPEVARLKQKAMVDAQKHQAELQKELATEIASHQDEIKKDMEEMQQDLREQQQEIERQVQKWIKSSEI